MTNELTPEMLRGLAKKQASRNGTTDLVLVLFHVANAWAADRLALAEALLHRIDQRGYVGDQDHEDIQRLLSGGSGPARDDHRWFGRDGSKWEGE